ncbi:hypothetical protein WN51_11864 [Melipona quadrifasciata]|uniref:Uncharacterized protein n=1 Tax=Melipona quadrifasciata TaxID=166423 RepID=A0A0M9A538_9HYME|nr:hypothetical protein WN51_11864 [Melipona quadrifasciata]
MANGFELAKVTGISYDCPPYADQPPYVLHKPPCPEKLPKKEPPPPQ